MRDDRTWVPVEVIWDWEARTAAEHPRPPRRAEARDEYPAPRRRKGEEKRRGQKRRPHEIDQDW